MRGLTIKNKEFYIEEYSNILKLPEDSKDAKELI